MAKILILGGGFAGLVTAESLAESIDRQQHEITLISPSRNFTFYPALVRLAFGECDADEITFDLRSRLLAIGVRYIQGELLDIEPVRSEAIISGPDVSGRIDYDIIVLAMGRRLATETVPGFFEHAHHLLGTKAANEFGTAVTRFSEGTIVIGMCPGARLPVPVCESAFATAGRFAKQIEERRVSVKVVFPSSLADAFGGADIHKELEAAFERHGINVLYDVPIAEITDDHLVSTEKHRIEYDLAMLVPPFKGQSILHDLGITDESDFIKVDGAMKVHGLANAYAAGDNVAFSGPKLAHMAVRQAKVVAANIASELAGKLPEENYYHEVASIIDAGGRDSMYLHYGIWDDELYSVRKGITWGWIKEAHDAAWRHRHSKGA